MRFQFLLIPPALIAFQTPTAAAEGQPLEAAQAILFPGTTLSSADFTLSDEQAEKLKAEYKVPLMRQKIKLWRAASGGWLYLDQVYGRDDIVTYLVALNENGALRGIEILTCAEGYCGIATPEWRAQLVGKASGKWDPKTSVPMISGTTLSSVHIGEGVKKILAIHALFLPQGK